MSTTLSTLDLVNNVIERCKFGIGSPLAMARLNEAYRRVCQPQGMVWLQKRTTLTVTTSATTVALPADIDIGKPKVLGGPTGMLITIPYQPWEEFLLQTQFYNTTATSTGSYSAWSYATNYTAAANGTCSCTVSNATIGYVSGTAFDDSWIGQTIVINSNAYTITAHPTSTTLTISPVFASSSATYSFQTSAFYAYLAYLAPAAAANASGSTTLPFIYHTKPTVLTMSASQFFPSPDDFDDVLVWLAAASIQQTYGIVGWQALREDAMQAMAPLIDVYKSTNLDVGLMDQSKVTAEANAKRAE